MLLRPIGILFGITALLLMLVSPVTHIILSKKCLNNKIKLPLWIIHIIAAILGFSLPVLAMFSSMIGLAPGIKCATGCAGCMVLGWFISIISFPIIVVWAFLIHRKKKNELLIL
jgi:hypothetical protein